jgi:predicted MFS family arabinose efflux permease
VSEQQHTLHGRPAPAGRHPAPAQPLGALAILRISGYLAIYLNAALVFLGVMGQAVARSWLAFELTGSNAALGGVMLAFGIAMLITTPWGGVAADRWPKRLILQIAIVLLVASSAWIGLAVAFDVIAYWMLLGAGVLQGVAFALFNPARMAFLAELVPPGSISRAVSLLLVNAEVNRVVGPALAGVLIAGVSFGIEAVFLATAGLAVLGLLLTAALPPGRRRGDPPDRSPLGELADGLRYVRRHGQLAPLLWCGIGVAMAGLPYLAFLPTVASDLFGLGPAGYGLLSATSAVGAVVVGLLLGRRSLRAHENRVLVAGGAVAGLGLVGLALAPAFPVAVAALFVIGGAMLAFQTSNQSLLISLSDMEYHGRVQGLIMLSFGAFGVAALPLGALADAIGLRWTLAGMGLGVVVFVASYALVTRDRMRAAGRLRDVG